MNIVRMAYLRVVEAQTVLVEKIVKIRTVYLVQPIKGLIIQNDQFFG